MWDQFLWPRFPGRVEMHRWTDVHCWPSAGAFGTFRPHIHTCRGVWVLALVHWPGAGLYPPAPQSLLSPAAVPVGSNPSAFSVSLIPFPNHFYNSPSPWNLPSLSFFFSHQILFITLIIKFFFSKSPCFPHTPVMHTSLSLSLSLIFTPGQLFRFYPTFLKSLCGGPESSDCSTRMSDSHILTFRQPEGPKGSSSLNQSHPLFTFRELPQADWYSWHRWSAGVNLHGCFTPSVVQRGCFMAV